MCTKCVRLSSSAHQDGVSSSGRCCGTASGGARPPHKSWAVIDENRKIAELKRK